MNRYTQIRDDLSSQNCKARSQNQSGVTNMGARPYIRIPKWRGPLPSSPALKWGRLQPQGPSLRTLPHIYFPTIQYTSPFHISLPNPIHIYPHAHIYLLLTTFSQHVPTPLVLTSQTLPSRLPSISLLSALYRDRPLIVSSPSPAPFFCSRIADDGVVDVDVDVKHSPPTW